MQHRTWRSFAGLSRGLALVERFLACAGFDRAPWAAVALAAGIGSWFALPGPEHWLAFIAGCLAIGAFGACFFAGDGDFPFLRQSLIASVLLIAAGCALVWAKSAIVGSVAIERPMAVTLAAGVLEREDQPAEGRVRLVLATREPETGRPIRVRVNLEQDADVPGLEPGARIRLRVRLMPPAPPMLPGGYNFARAAWFAGFSATGSVIGPVDVMEPARGGRRLASVRNDLSAHIRDSLPGSAGGIAAALASGDQGAVSAADAQAMRDSGLAHLLSVSGLHVSAVTGAAYLIAMKVLALFPWFALRLRLPLLAASAAAVTGIGYTVLTGSEVPTVRSCIGTLLVLAALALGRDALSLRMVAVAAIVVLVFWPEAVVGPSFQMSFGAVIAIVALHSSEPIRRFLAPREESIARRTARHLTMLLITGLAIELALMPIGLFHFHRAGLYGALANVIAIPLTTIVTMPLLAFALILDLAGAGGPAWMLTGWSIDAVLAIAHWVASRPGAVTIMPAMGTGAVLLFIAGGLWLALWRGAVRFAGIAPILVGAGSLLALSPPDLLVSSDGRHVGITDSGTGEFFVLRESRSGYARDNLVELSGMNGTMRRASDWPGAKCSREFCALVVDRGGRSWRLLLGRGNDRVPERALAAACAQSDIVVSDRWLPASCRPAFLKADRRLLGRTGGLSINLRDGEIATVAANEGAHGWWRPVADKPRYAAPRPSPSGEAQDALTVGKGAAPARKAAGAEADQ